MTYPDPKMYIAGTWRSAGSGRTLPVINPATEEILAQVPLASETDLDEAVAAASACGRVWSNTSAFERAAILRKAAGLLRDRADDIARILTQEQGKPLIEARGEVLASADVTDWMADEGRRNYGRIIPARDSRVQQMVIREPVGVVAAFTPWNFPLNQAVRKITAALATGCTMVIKAPEETPASPMELVRAFADAGVPSGALNLVFGIPAEVSEFLIPHPLVRKISFTGSTAIGKKLAALAGLHMKRCTMELGGHAPAIVFPDADVDAAATLLAGHKFRNAGQVCVSPTRFLIHEAVYDRFVDRFAETTRQIKVGNGLDEGVTMGPLAHDRRLSEIEAFVADALETGAELVAGGERMGNKGYFYQPTVLRNLSPDARILNEEPFGPVAPMLTFRDTESLIAEANRLNYGLAAYAFTGSAETRALLADRIETGMITMNHLGLGLPEVPFGGIKDSGYGSEGGSEALEPYVNTKFVTQKL